MPLCQGGKWKVLYGVSDGKVLTEGLQYKRIKARLAQHEQVGEVFIVKKGNTCGNLMSIEAMVKMSSLEMRPKDSCGTEIALFDSRADAIKFIKYFSSQVQEKNPSKVRVHVSYADPKKGSLSLDNYKSEENKKRYDKSRIINKSEISRGG